MGLPMTMQCLECGGEVWPGPKCLGCRLCHLAGREVGVYCSKPCLAEHQQEVHGIVTPEAGET